MTSPQPEPQSDPTARRRISSTPVLRAALTWGGLIGVVLVAASAGVGALVAGGDGALSGAVGASVGIVFPALTAVTILVGNRWYGSPSYLQIFFGVVLGGWLLKFVLVIVALMVLLNVEWMVTGVFFWALVAAAIASLVVDLIVMSRMRLPAVSDVQLPTVPPAER